MMRAGLVTLASAAVLALPAAGQERIDVASMGYDKGSPNAPITIVEFGDFACSACGLFARETLPVVNREWIAAGKVRIKYIPFILGIFPRAHDAARAGECAAEQNSFWPMHDLLYERQRDWTGLGDSRAKFEAYAREIGLDVSRFRSCWDADRGRDKIQANTQIALRLQIRGTPTFFINGSRIQGAIPLDQMKAILESMDRR